MILTSSLLLADVKRKAALTSGASGFGNADLLQLATQAMQSDLSADLRRLYSGYGLVSEALPLVVGQSHYRIPARAAGQTLRHLWYERAGTRRPLTQYEIEDLEDLAGAGGGTPLGYYIEGNDLVLVPAVTQAQGTLAVRYYFQPNALAAESACRQVVAVSGAELTLASLPVEFVAGQLFDVIENRSGNNIVLWDQTLASLDSGANTLTFAAALPGVRVGHWVAPAGVSPVPMLPESMHEMLVEAVCVRIAQARAHEMQLKMALSRLGKMRSDLYALLGDRVSSKHAKVVGQNPFLVR